MPRQARRKSESGIYHVMLRGINQQQIFEDAEDCEKFIEILKDCKAISEYKLFAYCLMGNHIHLLIQEGKEPLDLVFKRIGSKYVYWYNIKYRRTGHLFQDRFKSEVVESERYFYTVIRYIHQNPIKAGICRKISDYVYSSYGEYIGEKYVIDIETALDKMTLEQFAEFNCQLSSDLCLDIVSSIPACRVTDEQAKEIINQYTKCKNVAEFQLLDIKVRDKYLKLLREKGLSIRQISRLTGVSFNIVRKF